MQTEQELNSKMERLNMKPALQVSTVEHPIVKKTFEKICEILRHDEDLESSSAESRRCWFDRVMQYNVPHGKLWRLLQVIQSFESMSSNAVSVDDLEKASILGWMVEMFQAFYLILDDIMDKSTTRRNRKCWYLVEDVGLIAINDASLLETAVFKIIKRIFQNHPSYLNILELFLETHYRTTRGQCLDMLNEHEPVWNEERYNSIVELKTSYYTFSLPIRLGMYLALITDPEKHRAAETIAKQVGNLFQVQDDFLDCFGDPEKIGKVGTDIIDAKCSWLLVKALEIANPKQKQVILENIGKGEAGGCQEQAVKAVYQELQIEKLFRQHETQSFENLRTTIRKMELQYGLNTTIFELIVEKIHRREK